MNGSFIVSAFATINGKKYYLGTESVLSDNYTDYNTKVLIRQVKADFRLQDFMDESLNKASFDFIVHGREESLPLMAKPVVDSKRFYRL